MVLQDKHKRAASAKYRATHGGIQSNRQAARGRGRGRDADFPQASEAGQRAGEGSQPAKEDGGEENEASSSNASEGETEGGSSFARRKIVSNADRYEEPDEDPDAEPEPEIDYTTFNAKQKEKASSPVNGDPDDNDVDTSFAHLRLGPKSKPKPAGYINAADLVVMDEERKKADAARALRARFTGNARVEASPSSRLPKSTQAADSLAAPMDDEDFLDEVLADASGTYGNIRRKK